MKYSILFILLLMSCSGYRFKNRNNPLAQYGIRSVSIPTFYNHSSLPSVSTEFTKEFYKVLGEFKKLRVYTGHNEKTDAVLVGVIRSRDSLLETKRVSQYRIAKGVADDDIGDDRPNFKIPAATSLNLQVRVYLIRNPSEEELALLNTEIADSLQLSSKLIFKENISVGAGYTREIFGGESKSINFTQNWGQNRRTVSRLAERAASSFREIILYAF
ncbi:hypothetical protein N9N67_01605 [Bacteriovoracaceae bacterium]|nr:hypothetical protein [Bacteriovoracaceae bacterium]